MLDKRNISSHYQIIQESKLKKIKLVATSIYQENRIAYGIEYDSKE